MSSSMTKSPLGIFGGTFDPLHIGHLRLAIEAGENLGLTAVRFIPAGQPPLRDTPRTPAAHRLAMVRLAVADTPGFTVDASEAESPAMSYTVDTLERLRRELGPAQPLVLLLGADAFARLESWQRWRELFELAHIAVATRPGHALKVGAGDTATAANSALNAEFQTRHGLASDLATAPAGRIVPFAITGLEISATALRQRLAAGLDARHLAPAAVLDYIHQHHLYR